MVVMVLCSIRHHQGPNIDRSSQCDGRYSLHVVSILHWHIRRRVVHVVMLMRMVMGSLGGLAVGVTGRSMLLVRYIVLRLG